MEVQSRMNGSRASRSGGVGRRAFLAAGAAGVGAATSGCVGRVESVVDGHERQLSLSITTVPDDDDRQTIELAAVLRRNLEAIGVDVSIDLRTTEEYLRSILFDHEFDLYVGRCPVWEDPDYLYELLHSRFAAEVGRQNPFGYTDRAVDDHLERQRTTDGERRASAVASVLQTLVEEKPFVPVCAPDEYRVVRPDRFDGWRPDRLATRRGYLGLDPSAETDRLVGIVNDARPTQNLNPFAVHYRNRGTVVDLLYDSLATVGDERDPWLAESWEWDQRDLRITVRPGCRFHDGEPLTAGDVAFTYRFLVDASLGAADSPVHPTRYRAEAAAIEGVELHDERTCTITVDTGRTVGERLLTVPILPERVWREAVSSASDAGDVADVADRVTREVLLSEDVPPIGSGPFALAGRSERERLVFRRFDDHFTLRADVDVPAPTVEELRLLVDPGSASAIQQVGSGRADATVSTLEAHVVDAAVERDDVDALESPTGSFYHVGFNVRKSPLGNPYLRRVVAGLLDRDWIVEEVFDGHAEPVVAPVDDEWVPERLAWDGADPVAPFFGTDGDLDVEAARAAIDRIGFRYDEDGRLVINN